MAPVSQERRGDLVVEFGSGEDGYGLSPQDPPVPSRSAKHRLLVTNCYKGLPFVVDLFFDDPAIVCRQRQEVCTTHSITPSARCRRDCAEKDG